MPPRPSRRHQKKKALPLHNVIVLATVCDCSTFTHGSREDKDMNGPTGVFPAAPSLAASSESPAAATPEPQPPAGITMKAVEDDGLYAYRRGGKPNR